MKTKNRTREKQLRPLTQMQLETLVTIYYGEVSIAAPVHRGFRNYIEVYAGPTNITGRLRSLFNRRLIRRNYEGAVLVGFMVTPKGMAEITMHPEILNA